MKQSSIRINRFWKIIVHGKIFIKKKIFLKGRMMQRQTDFHVLIHSEAAFTKQVGLSRTETSGFHQGLLWYGMGPSTWEFCCSVSWRLDPLELYYAGFGTHVVGCIFFLTCDIRPFSGNADAFERWSLSVYCSDCMLTNGSWPSLCRNRIQPMVNCP